MTKKLQDKAQYDKDVTDNFSGKLKITHRNDDPSRPKSCVSDNEV